MTLSRASAADVVPGRTGLDQNGAAAGVLITGVNGRGVASLSRPLPTGLRAGPVAAATLRFAPFAPPRLADGAPNPRFQRTLTGWLSYVKAVAELGKSAYGLDDFDVEVWNEVGSASEFLSEGNYYSPVPDPGATGNVLNAILGATVRMLANPPERAYPRQGRRRIQRRDAIPIRCDRPERHRGARQAPLSGAGQCTSGVGARAQHPAGQCARSARDGGSRGHA